MRRLSFAASFALALGSTAVGGVTALADPSPPVAPPVEGKQKATTLDELPGSARASIQKHAAGGKVLGVEAITNPMGRYYDATVSKNGKLFQVVVDDAGHLVRPSAQRAR